MLVCELIKQLQDLGQSNSPIVLALDGTFSEVYHIYIDKNDASSSVIISGDIEIE